MFFYNYPAVRWWIDVSDLHANLHCLAEKQIIRKAILKNCRLRQSVIYRQQYLSTQECVWSNDLSPIFQQTSVKLYVHCAKYTHTLYTRESLHEKKNRKPIMQLNRISSAICHLVLSSSHDVGLWLCVRLRTPMNFVFHPSTEKKFLKVTSISCIFKIKAKLAVIRSILTFSLRKIFTSKNHVIFLQCIFPFTLH